MKVETTFKPKKVTKTLLAVLPERTRDIIVNRFGLGDDAEKKTLESIGNQYSITRERVRQVENFALQSIKKSDAFAKEKAAFDELHRMMVELGSVIAEDDFLEAVSKDASTQNHTHLLLVLGDQFNKKKEDDYFKHRWTVNEQVSEKIHSALMNTFKGLSENDLVSEQEIVTAFLGNLHDLDEKMKHEENARRWLGIAKVIGRNPLGEWGIATSPNIRARGARDYAYLVIRRHGSPLHFTEVAKEISRSFGRKAHVATCHNELIKDNRFVLVGRGIYGLAEWGYNQGVVRDVIMNILRDKGPMGKKDLVDHVLKERYVKENTVIVNLQNKKFFKKDSNGNYLLA